MKFFFFYNEDVADVNPITKQYMQEMRKKYIYSRHTGQDNDSNIGRTDCNIKWVCIYIKFYCIKVCLEFEHFMSM